MDNEYGSMWVNCSVKRCQYWCHIECLGFSVDDENAKTFSGLVKFFCQKHKKSLPRPKAVMKKLID